MGCLQDKHMLLLLGNFEHLISAAAVVSELLAAAPRLNALVTGRDLLIFSRTAVPSQIEETVVPVSDQVGFGTLFGAV